MALKVIMTVNLRGGKVTGYDIMDATQRLAHAEQYAFSSSMTLAIDQRRYYELCLDRQHSPGYMRLLIGVGHLSVKDFSTDIDPRETYDDVVVMYKPLSVEPVYFKDEVIIELVEKFRNKLEAELLYRVKNPS